MQQGHTSMRASYDSGIGRPGRCMDRVLQRMSQRKRLHPMGVIYEEDWESNDEDSGELVDRAPA
jgi:hypothetical protein